MNLNREEIMAVMPHRDPLLLVDRIEDLIPGESATGYFYVRPDMEIFKGHFPGNPLFPGAYQIECMGQVGNLMVQAHSKYAGMTSLFLGCNGSSFKKKVVPGDTLKVCAKIKNFREDKLIAVFTCECFVGEDLVSTGELAVALR